MSVTLRDVTFCHDIFGIPALPGTTGNYPALPGSSRPGNLRAISGISNDLQRAYDYSNNPHC
eukprot:1343102-Amorphochlora_amoeboformis.AAC.1